VEGGKTASKEQLLVEIVITSASMLLAILGRQKER